MAMMICLLVFMPLDACVCLSVHCEMAPCKNGWTSQDAVWHVVLGWPSNHVLNGGLDLLRETGMLGHARRRYIQQHDAAFYRITSISRLLLRHYYNCVAIHNLCVFNKYVAHILERSSRHDLVKRFDLSTCSMKESGDPNKS